MQLHEINKISASVPNFYDILYLYFFRNPTYRYPIILLNLVYSIGFSLVSVWYFCYFLFVRFIVIRFKCIYDFNYLHSVNLGKVLVVVLSSYSPLIYKLISFKYRLNIFFNKEVYFLYYLCHGERCNKILIWSNI